MKSPEVPKICGIKSQQKLLENSNANDPIHYVKTFNINTFKFNNQVLNDYFQKINTKSKNT